MLCEGSLPDKVVGFFNINSLKLQQVGAEISENRKLHQAGAEIEFPAIQGKLAQEIVKDTYDFGFVSLPIEY